VSRPHYEYDKAFLVAAHGSMSIDDSLRTKLKVLGLAYSLRKTPNML
jgi:hypothetical protein